MKKLVITSAIICLSVTTVFAGPKLPAGAIKSEPRVGGKPGAAPKVGELLPGSQVTVRPNSGVDSAQEGNILDEAARNAIGDKFGSTVICNTTTLTAAQMGAIAEARARGLSNTRCIDEKFKGEVNVQVRAQKVIAAMNQAFTNLGIKKITTDAQRAIILKAGAAVLTQDLPLTLEEALANLEQTVALGCDVVSASLGTASAFAAARSI